MNYTCTSTSNVKQLASIRIFILYKKDISASSYCCFNRRRLNSRTLDDVILDVNLFLQEQF